MFTAALTNNMTYRSLLKRWYDWSPLPLRLILGLYLAGVGSPMLFTEAGRANAEYVLTGLGIPLAGIVVWGVGAIAFLGGLTLVIGAFVPIAALLHIFSIGSHLLFALVGGGFPPPLPGEPMPVPGLHASILLIAAMVALVNSGAGALSVDALRGANLEPRYPRESVLRPLCIVPGLYLAILGTPMLFTAGGRAETVQVLSELGIPLAGVVVWGVGAIAFFGGLALLFGIAIQTVALLQIFSIGSHLLFALFRGGFPQPPSGYALPIPDMHTSIVLLAIMASLVVAGAGVEAMRRARKLNLLNVLAKIKPGEEDALRQVLAEINANLTNNSYVRFPDSILTHFARFIITNDKDNGLRLGMGVTYTGELEPYIEELLRVSPGLDAVWGKCEEYTGRDNFLQFVRDHSHESVLVYFGFPTASVPEIRSQILLRERLQEFLGTDPQGLEALIEALQGIAAPPSFFQYALERIAAWQEATVVWLRRMLVPPAQAGARRLGNIDLPKQWSRITNNYTGDTERIQRELATILSLEDSEGLIAQTTMSLFADVKPDRVWLLRLIFWISPPLLVYGWPLGNFAGVYSLHSFRFALIDGGKRLWFMSNYNGSAENYFSDFIDKLNWGINTAYTNCLDYPVGGMYQNDAFGFWIRVRQFPALVYYSAYPMQSIHKISTDREISQILGRNLDLKTLDRLLAML